MLLFKPGCLRLRRASKNDYNAIRHLLEDHWAVHTRLPLEEIEAKLDSRLSFLVEDQVALRGFMMVESQPPKNALIMAAAVHDNSKTSTFLNLVLPTIEAELRQQQLKYLIQIGAADWLNKELLKHDFEMQEEIITFEWQAQSLPPLPPHPKLLVREVHISDLPGLLVYLGEFEFAFAFFTLNAIVRRKRIQLIPPFFTKYFQVIEIGMKAGITICNCTTWELQLK